MAEKGLFLRDVQQDEVVDYCGICGRELYEGDDAYFDGGNGVYICDDKRALGWQNSRSLHRGYKFGFLEYENSIKPMLNKAIKVDNLRKLCHWGEYDCLGIR